MSTTTCLMPKMALIVALGAACSPQADSFSRNLRKSEGALQCAKAAQAEASPLAALHLHLAQEQLLEAKRLYQAGKLQQAQSLLSRAEVDAQLALALVQEVAARAEADELTDRLVDLHAHVKGSATAEDDSTSDGDEVAP